MDIPKKQFALLKDTPNVISLPQSTVDTAKVDDYDKNMIIQMMKLLLHRVSHFSTKFMDRKVNDNFGDIDFVHFRKYPLVASFNERTGRPVVNLLTFGKKEVGNIENRALYAAIVYAYLCKLFTLRPLKMNMYQDVSMYMSHALMKMFGKKYGIMASYEDMIPKLQFIVTSYILVSFFGERQKNTYSKAARFGASVKDFNINFDDYNFEDTRAFIKSLSDSGVFPGISTMDFAGFIINRYGMLMLPLFEDGMRFMATLGASSMPTGGLFPPYLEKLQPTIYDKFLKYITGLV